MKTIECFEVFGNTDTTEGRGPMKIVARFSNENEAIKYVKSPAYKRWCVMGYQSNYDLNNIHKSVIIILDSLDEFEVYTKEDLRRKALNKLSKEEQEALGLV